MAVVIAPADSTLTSIGDSLQLVAEGRLSSGAGVAGLTFTWTSSDTLKVRVTSRGLAIAVSPGEATITAATDSVAGSARVTVAPVAAAVVVTPPSATLVGVGSTLQLAAGARDARGHAIAGLPVAWASSDSSIARISSTGLVTAVLAGTTTIAATAGGASGASNVHVRMSSGLSKWLAVVSGSGQSATQHQKLRDSLVVRAFDQDGVPIPGATVTFAAPPGGGQMTCNRAGLDSWGWSSVQATTASDGTATFGMSGYSPANPGCTPHSAGQVLLQASSPGFEPATFSFDVVAAGQRFDGVYGLSTRTYWFEVRNGVITDSWCAGYACTNGTITDADGAVYYNERAGLDCWNIWTGHMTIDSLGLARGSGVLNAYCAGSQTPVGSGTWSAGRH